MVLEIELESDGLRNTIICDHFIADIQVIHGGDPNVEGEIIYLLNELFKDLIGFQEFNVHDP